MFPGDKPFTKSGKPVVRVLATDLDGLARQFGYPNQFVYRITTDCGQVMFVYALTLDRLELNVERGWYYRMDANPTLQARLEVGDKQIQEEQQLKET